jgi:hypothetical protein
MNEKPLQDDEFFARLAESAEPVEPAGRAPARLKARLYSALIRRQQASGPLLSLTDTRTAGRGLCVFESLWENLPVGEAAKHFNCCSICHARVLGEQVERAPIYWGHCPYVAFGKK